MQKSRIESILEQVHKIMSEDNISWTSGVYDLAAHDARTQFKKSRPRPYPLKGSRFQVQDGEVVDTEPEPMGDHPDRRVREAGASGRGLAQRLAYDPATRQAFDAQMQTAKDAAIQRRINKRKELGMPELTRYSPEMTGKSLNVGNIDRSKLSDPEYRKEAIRQINDTRSADQKRQDREAEQTIDAVRQGGQAKQDAISRFNQSLVGLQSKASETEKKMKEMGLG